MPDPLLSIVVPTFQRPQNLQQILSITLKQLASLGTDCAEIVIVDNSLEASAIDVVTQFLSERPERVRFLHERRRGVVYARNAAVAAVRGKFVVFLDDDEYPRPGWLSGFINAAMDGNVACFGSIEPRYEQTEFPLRGITDAMFSRRFNLPTGSNISRHWARLGTGNAMFSRDLFEPAPAFDMRFNLNGGEDMVFIRRLLARGVKLVWSNEAAVEELVPPSRCELAYLKKRRFIHAQLRCQITSVEDDRTALRVATWMSIGLVQAVFNTAGFVLARLLHRKSAPRHLIGLHGGLGKVFWKLPTGTALYAESEDLID